MKSINYKGKLCLFVLLSIVCIMLFPATVFAENEDLTLIEGVIAMVSSAADAVWR